MEQYLRIALPLYFLCYVVFLVVIRSLAVRKEIGKSPVVVESSDDLFGLINNYFKTVVFLVTIYLMVFALLPAYYQFFLPVGYLETGGLKIAGVILLLISFLIVFFAQIHMRKSFRIGIDHGAQTELISGGLFRYSRNPIYVGMIVSMFGLFLVTPNAFTLLVLAAASILIQVQVRLEEDYLLKNHGPAFLAYKSKVRRFI